MYELRYSAAAQKYFKKIKEKGLRKAFEDGLTSMAENPYSGSAKIGDLASLYGYDVFYNKTNYEIAYRIYENEAFVVFCNKMSKDIRHIIFYVRLNANVYMNQEYIL